MKSDFRKPQVCIIFAQHQTVFSPGCKHPVGFSRTTSYKIIYQNSHIGLGPVKDKCVPVLNPACCIDSCPQPLGSRFFISGSSIYLSGHKQVGKQLGLKRRLELNRIYIIIFNGISRPHNFSFLQPFHRSHKFYLNLQGKAVSKTAGINFICINPLVFENNLMAIPLRKTNHFILKRRAIPCCYRL